MAYLERTIRRMAWHKMNMLHLHFTEWVAFRLQSDSFPGLADEHSYSKDDIRKLQDLAARYHIMLIPEIDLPAHATAITNYNPSLRFRCPSMDFGRWANGKTGWMIDITKSENREWIKTLLDEFIPLFDAPYFHIGADEWEFDNEKAACPDLVEYAVSKGFSFHGDVIIEWLNEVNTHVKSHGKQMMIWYWWLHDGQQTSIHPDKDIVIHAWCGKDPSWFLDEGYTVMATSDQLLYITPGASPGNTVGEYGYVDARYIYEDWSPSRHERLLGYNLCIWADFAETMPSDYFDWFSTRPQEAFADKSCGGPLRGNIDVFNRLADHIGAAPGWRNSNHILIATTGLINPLSLIDLGESDRKVVTRIRFKPKEDQARAHVGGKFQGSITGAEEGYIDLFTIPWIPPIGWNEASIADSKPYRWIRYLPPEGKPANAIAFEVYTDIGE